MKSKADIAYEFIKSKIIKNELKSEEIISENQFANELNISRTPVRSAFQKLASEGFMKILPSRGAVIQEMSIKEAHDIYDLRIAVETFVLKKAFDFITTEDIKNLRNIIKEQKNAYITEDVAKCMESMDYDIKFHAYFSRYYKNEKIEEIIRNFTERFTEYGFIALTKPGRIHTTISEHEAIIDALEKRDLTSAVANLETHFENAKIHLLIK